MSPQLRRHSHLGALPTDLILQILSRLPAKSIARCRCVSKLWASLLTLGSPYFTELFFTHSKTRPRLLFIILRNNEWCLYSSPQPQISDKNPKSSLSVTAEFHMYLPKTKSRFPISSRISGLIYLSNVPSFKSSMLCNPSTGHLFSVPQVRRTLHSYFGYDPVNKQFSILAVSPPDPTLPLSYQILKLGSGRLSWRSLEYPLHHYPSRTNICINGILYYGVFLMHQHPSHKIASFDLNSEEFRFIDQPWNGKPRVLVNFKGKLGIIKVNWVEFSNERFHLELSLWVLEDANKQDWSSHVYNILPIELWNRKSEPYDIVGLTATGDIVLTLSYTTNPFYVYFFNLEKKTLQKVEIKGFEGLKRDGFYSCVEYVEELRALKWN